MSCEKSDGRLIVASCLEFVSRLVTLRSVLLLCRTLEYHNQRAGCVETESCFKTLSGHSVTCGRRVCHNFARLSVAGRGPGRRPGTCSARRAPEAHPRFVSPPIAAAPKSIPLCCTARPIDPSRRADVLTAHFHSGSGPTLATDPARPAAGTDRPKALCAAAEVRRPVSAPSLDTVCHYGLCAADSGRRRADASVGPDAADPYRPLRAPRSQKRARLSAYRPRRAERRRVCPAGAVRSQRRAGAAPHPPQKPQDVSPAQAWSRPRTSCRCIYGLFI